MSNFKQSISEYLSIDNEILSIEEQLNKLKDDKYKLEQTIISFIKERQLVGKNIKIGSDILRYVEGTSKAPLTHTLLHNALNKYFMENYSNKLSKDRCEAKANEMFDFILNCREDKDRSALKRIPNN